MFANVFSNVKFISNGLQVYFKVFSALSKIFLKSPKDRMGCQLDSILGSEVSVCLVLLLERLKLSLEM